MQLVSPPAIASPPRRVSGLGVASFVLGTIALMFSWLPIAGCALIPVAILGLALGVPALVIAIKDRTRGVGFPIAGIITNLMALLVCLFVILVLSALMQSSSQQMQPRMYPPAAAR